MRDTRASERVLVWQVSDQLRAEVLKLTRGEPLTSDHKLRSHIEDAAAEIGRNLEKALATDHLGECTRFLRLARAAVNDVQAGLRAAIVKKHLRSSDVSKAAELLSRLYPAITSLLVQNSSDSYRRSAAAPR
jgi:four helix bundle protein